MLLIQAIGFIALLFALLVFQVNQRGTMLKLQICAALLYASHFFLLGAYTGAAMNLASVVRNFIFYKVQRRRWFIPALFIVIFTIAGAATWQGPVSILPVLGMITGTLAFWQSNPKYIRLLALISPPLWFSYNFLMGSYPGMITEVIMFTSTCIGMFRFDLLKTQSKQH